MLEKCRIALALVIATSVGVAASEHEYKGPNLLGMFRMDGVVSVKMLQKILGIEVVKRGEHFCYAAGDGSAYLWFSTTAHHSNDVGQLLLSNFRNCIDSPVRNTDVNLRGWKTESGIGLGSAAGDVIKAYGPSERILIQGNNYRWVIKGDYEGQGRYSNRKRPELGEYALGYSADDELRSAAFGIRDGKVVWIVLSNTE